MGYVYSFADNLPMGSTSCVNQSTFCGKGTIGIADAMYKIFGGGIGVNLNQAQNSMTFMPAAATGAGVAYTLSSAPPAGSRLIIDNGATANTRGTDYCANITAASGTVTWAQFFPMCYAAAGMQGTALGTAPASASHIQFQVSSNQMTAGSFDFCITSLKFM
jgi:hypothetical protein